MGSGRGEEGKIRETGKGGNSTNDIWKKPLGIILLYGYLKLIFAYIYIHTQYIIYTYFNFNVCIYVY